MSAFQAYAGAYEFQGEAFAWRCYATARVHAVRKPEHTPFPAPASGLKWVWRSSSRHEPELAWLVDHDVDDFSLILAQVDAKPAPRRVVSTHRQAAQAHA